MTQTLTKLTDEQREIVENKIPLALYIADILLERNNYPKRIKQDDIISVAYVGLCRAVMVHDPSKGKLSTITNRCIANEISSLIYAQGGAMSIPRGSDKSSAKVRARINASIRSVSNSMAAVSAIDDEQINKYDNKAQTAIINDNISLAMSKLTDYERDIIVRHIIDGESIKSIAGNKSPRTIYRIVALAKIKIRKWLEYIDKFGSERAKFVDRYESIDSEVVS